MKDYTNALAFAQDFLAANPDQQMVHMGNLIVDRAGHTRRIDREPKVHDKLEGEKDGKPETR